LASNIFTLSSAPNTTNSHSQKASSVDPVNTMQWSCVNNKLTDSQREEIENVQFWVEGVCQFIIGCIGITSNLLAILILLRSKMIESFFNKLLTNILILHTIYIACEMLTEIIHPSWHNDTEQITQVASTLYVYYLLNPLGKFMLYSTTFFTALMAKQRYLASCYPTQYRDLTLTRNQLRDLIQYLIVVLLSSALITLPIYLETSIEYNEIQKLNYLNATHFKYVSSTNRDQFYAKN
jgi:hypothetical protein